MRRIARYLLVTVAVLGLVVAALPYGLYCAALNSLGALPTEPTHLYPSRVTRAAWVINGGTATMVTRDTGPWDLLLAFTSDRPLEQTRHLRNASIAARYWRLGHEKGDASTLHRHLQEAALALWINRHWSAAAIVTSGLSNAYYGHGTQGLDAAARRYFDLPVSELQPNELAILLNLTRGPSRFDPWCQPQRALQASLQLEAILGAEPRIGAVPVSLADYALRLRPAPEGSCAG
ncbi:MAG: transglycosylase domain-containing protein [Pseudomonas sp.]|uniref:transglycosylase domain-containing protein n=1 Tax=Pseudomonas sp. TaxID=306 RepID=UPI0033988359